MKIRSIFINGLVSLIFGIVAPQALAAPVNYCKHPLFPISGGSYWAYSGSAMDPQTGYTLTTVLVSTQQDISTAIMTLTYEGSDLMFPLGFACDQGGLKLIQDLSFTIPLGKQLKLTLQLREQEGYILPAIENVDSGVPWQMKALFSGTLYNAQKQTSIDINVLLEINSRLITKQSVVVPAGTFSNAYEIEQIFTWRLQGLKQESIPKGFSGMTHERMWYLAPNVGPVKAELRGAISELVEYLIR